ncbi:MAG: CSLREA domain-containing protein, partial [Actinobacteria bacterium]|nr:CSLREA domain-containing protein [Actinomycetota bacterium]
MSSSRKLTVRRSATLCAALVLLSSLSVALAPAAGSATTIQVDEVADEDNSDGDCSLREALIAANTDLPRDACPAGSGADTIELPAGTYDLTIAGQGEEAAATGDLDITESVTISGGGAAATIVDGQDLDRVVDVIGAATVVEISGVTIRNGSSPDGGPAGGIHSAGTLTLTDSVVSGNVAVNSDAGGMKNAGGTLTLTNSTVSGNSATGNGNGGGIMTVGGTLTLTNSTVSGNTGGFGGGLNIQGTATITNSTVSGNTASGGGAGFGGGIQNNGGAVSLTNSTISGNTASSQGGGIFQNCCGGFTLVNATVASNTGTGIHLEGGATPPNALNTIVAGNSLSECSAALTSNGNNLDDDSTCFGGGTDVHGNPVLGPLSFNGGPTRTHALGNGSLAIDAGTNGGCPGADQRGVARPFDGDGDATPTCDIGAYEVAPTTFTPTRTDDPAPDGCAPEDCSLREAVIAANQDPAADTIQVPAGTYDLTIAGAGEDASATGDLDMTLNVTITGDGPDATIVDAGGGASLGDRVLHVMAGVEAV